MFFATTLAGSTELAILVKLLLAALAGAILGIEREKHGRPAGLRTHLLVTLGSCLMMVVSEAFFLKYGDLPGTGVVRLDPGRAAAQIITGIGFLGAGVIIKEGFTVRGLTTAACLWVAAGVGMSFGMGLFIAGTLATILSLLALIFLKQLEPIIQKDRYLHLSITANSEPDIYPVLEKLFAERKLRISDIEADLDLATQCIRYRFIITQHKERIGRELSQIIAEIDGVKKIHYQ